MKMIKNKLSNEKYKLKLKLMMMSKNKNEKDEKQHRKVKNGWNYEKYNRKIK